MGESLENTLALCSYLREQFGIEEVNIRTYSPLTLAFIGDGIYDIIIRTIVVTRANTSANKLHKYTSSIVKAETQARMIELLEEHLSKEEADIYRRGRNAKSYTTAKNASVADYRKATGFEALMGYLYLQDNMERAIELTKLGTELLELKIGF